MKQKEGNKERGQIKETEGGEEGTKRDKGRTKRETKGGTKEGQRETKGRTKEGQRERQGKETKKGDRIKLIVNELSGKVHMWNEWERMHWI